MCRLQLAAKEAELSLGSSHSPKTRGSSHSPTTRGNSHSSHGKYTNASIDNNPSTVENRNVTSEIDTANHVNNIDLSFDDFCTGIDIVEHFNPHTLLVVQFGCARLGEETRRSVVLHNRSDQNVQVVTPVAGCV